MVLAAAYGSMKLTTLTDNNLLGSRETAAEQVPHPLRRSRLAGSAPGIRDGVSRDDHRVRHWARRDIDRTTRPRTV